MTSPVRSLSCAAAALALAAATLWGSTPYVYAIRGARVVTAAGAPIPSGIVVIRNGLIEAVGPDVTAPAGAITIDGAGLTVYPGLIDMGNSTSVDVPAVPRPDTVRTLEEAERLKRLEIFRPDLLAADRLRAESPDLARLASSGITSVLATPAGSLVKGQSALVNVAAPADEPQIGNVGDYRRGLQILRTPVALHVEFPSTIAGDGYPVSLIGAIALVRQSFYDAQHQQAAALRYDRMKGVGLPRPGQDAALDALQPALAGKLPVAFTADRAREILRVLDIAQEFKLDPIISSGREADLVAADLKGRNARVIYSLNYPTRSVLLAPDAEEPLTTLRERARAPKVPAALDKAGIPFAFSSSGLREPGDFLRNAARAVKEGLPADAALRALTLGAARIAGAADRVGSIERGKIANLIVTDGDLFEEKTRIRRVFVDGREVTLDAPRAQPRRGSASGY